MSKLEKKWENEHVPDSKSEAAHVPAKSDAPPFHRKPKRDKCRDKHKYKQAYEEEDYEKSDLKTYEEEDSEKSDWKQDNDWKQDKHHYEDFEKSDWKRRDRYSEKEERYRNRTTQ